MLGEELTKVWELSEMTNNIYIIDIYLNLAPNIYNFIKNKCQKIFSNMYLDESFPAYISALYDIYVVV